MSAALAAGTHAIDPNVYAPRGRTHARAAVVLELRGVTAHAPNGTRLLDDVSLDAARGRRVRFTPLL